MTNSRSCNLLPSCNNKDQSPGSDVTDLWVMMFQGRDVLLAAQGKTSFCGCFSFKKEKNRTEVISQLD